MQSHVGSGGNVRSCLTRGNDSLALSLSLSPTPLPIAPKPKGTIRRGHHLEKIVAGNEPAVSGGLGSQVITHNDDDAM